jgi:hypothetical protein
MTIIDGSQLNLNMSIGKANVRGLWLFQKALLVFDTQCALICRLPALYPPLKQGRRKP